MVEFDRANGTHVVNLTNDETIGRISLTIIYQSSKI